MDISLAQTEKKIRFKKYIKPCAVVIGLIVVLTAVYNFKFSPYKVSLNSLSVAEVKFGDFSVEVRGNGVLLPQNISWVSASVDARVEDVIYKAGARVKKGDLLVRMSNPTVEQQYQENKLEYDALHAEADAKNADLKNKVLSQEAVVLEAKSRLLASQTRLTAQKKYILAVPMLEYETTRINTEQYRHQVAFEEKRLATLQQSVDADIKANQMRLRKSASLVALFKEKMESLNVTSPIDGILQDVTVQAGQRIVIGSNIARLAKEKDLYAELKVPELQSRDLTVGQYVNLNTGRSKLEGQVSRVDPAVVNGTVKVDVTITRPLPPEARPDLSVDGLIGVTKIEKALFVERPPYAQNNVSSIIYVIDKYNKNATKMKVNFGQGSADFIQITSGLRAGDKIILSDSSAWQGTDKIEIIE